MAIRDMKVKNVILKLGAVVFTAAYLLSLAGFDIHTCSHSGKTYISFLAASLSCEDIHPADEADAPCSCGHCHEQHHDNHEGGCCHDEAHQLLLGSDDSGFDVRHVSAPVCELPAQAVSDVFTSAGSGPVTLEWTPYVPSHAPDILHAFCILRI